MLTATPKETNTTRTLRRLAALFALLFVFISVSAALHTHAAVASSTASAPSKVVPHSHHNPSDHYDATSAQGVADCSLCNYLQTPFATTGTTAFAVTVCAALVALALATRIAALCAAPMPRRGLRAPPAFHAA